jgi:hypothetical protein
MPWGLKATKGLRGTVNHRKSSLVPCRLQTGPNPQGNVVSGETFLVRVRRQDGSEKILRVPAEHLQRVMDLACGEFGDPSIVHVGPVIPEG